MPNPLPNSMILAPSPIQQFTDNAGALLVGGRVFTYAAGTTTKQAAFTDASGAAALPNPIILNVRGEVAASSMGSSCGLWLDPTLAYKLVLSPANDTDPPTNAFWTIDHVVSPQSAILAALAQYEATLGGVPIGAMTAFGGATAPNGWILCFGQAVSRTTYAMLWAVIGTNYGPGDGSTTFNLPDKRGRASVGADNMGGSAANRVTQAVSGILATQVGQAGGSQLAQTDTITASSTANIAVSDPGHLHEVTGTLMNGILAPDGNTGDGGWTSYQQPLANKFLTDTSPTNITVSASVATTATSALAGASQNMPPVEVDNWIIFAGTSS